MAGPDGGAEYPAGLPLAGPFPGHALSPGLGTGGVLQPPASQAGAEGLEFRRAEPDPGGPVQRPFRGSFGHFADFLV